MRTKPPQPPRPLLQPAPKLNGSGNSARVLTVEEKAALFDEAVSYQAEISGYQDQIDRLRFKIATAQSELLALYLRGNSSKVRKEVCSLCNFENCVCERTS